MFAFMLEAASTAAKAADAATGAAVNAGGFSSCLGGSGTSMWSMIIIYVVIIGGFYLIAIRPQKKREKEHKALIDNVAVGDSVLTTSGFYGVVIDMTDEIVIVEFGNNKNCRIPMQRAAIVEVDKAEEA